jgi:hypothetical protein
VPNDAETVEPRRCLADRQILCRMWWSWVLGFRMRHAACCCTPSATATAASSSASTSPTTCRCRFPPRTAKWMQRSLRSKLVTHGPVCVLYSIPCLAFTHSPDAHPFTVSHAVPQPEQAGGEEQRGRPATAPPRAPLHQPHARTLERQEHVRANSIRYIEVSGESHFVLHGIGHRRLVNLMLISPLSVSCCL